MVIPCEQLANDSVLNISESNSALNNTNIVLFLCVFIFIMKPTQKFNAYLVPLRIIIVLFKTVII